MLKGAAACPNLAWLALISIANEEYCKLLNEGATKSTVEDHTRNWVDERLATVDCAWSEVRFFEDRFMARTLGLWGQERIIPQPSHIAYLVLALAVNRGKRHVKDIEDLLFLFFPFLMTGASVSELSACSTALLSRLDMRRRCNSEELELLERLEGETMACILSLLAAHYVFHCKFDVILRWATARFSNSRQRVVLLWRRPNNTVFRIG